MGRLIHAKVSVGVPCVGQRGLWDAKLVAYDASEDRIWMELENVIILAAARDKVEQVAPGGDVRQDLMGDIERHGDERFHERVRSNTQRRDFYTDAFF